MQDENAGQVQQARNHPNLVLAIAKSGQRLHDSWERLSKDELFRELTDLERIVVQHFCPVVPNRAVLSVALWQILSHYGQADVECMESDTMVIGIVAKSLGILSKLTEAVYEHELERRRVTLAIRLLYVNDQIVVCSILNILVNFLKINPRTNVACLIENIGHALGVILDERDFGGDHSVRKKIILLLTWLVKHRYSDMPIDQFASVLPHLVNEVSDASLLCHALQAAKGLYRSGYCGSIQQTFKCAIIDKVFSIVADPSSSETQLEPAFNFIYFAIIEDKDGVLQSLLDAGLLKVLEARFLQLNETESVNESIELNKGADTSVHWMMSIFLLLLENSDEAQQDSVLAHGVRTLYWVMHAWLGTLNSEDCELRRNCREILETLCRVLSPNRIQSLKERFPLTQIYLLLSTYPDEWPGDPHRPIERLLNADKSLQEGLAEIAYRREESISKRLQTRKSLERMIMCEQSIPLAISLRQASLLLMAGCNPCERLSNNPRRSIFEIAREESTILWLRLVEQSTILLLVGICETPRLLAHHKHWLAKDIWRRLAECYYSLGCSIGDEKWMPPLDARNQ